MRTILAILLLSVMSWATTYTTSFPANENPLSESASWLNGSADGGGRWANVATSNGVAQDTLVQSTGGSHSYNDALAILTGSWGATQSACGTVYINPSWRGRNNGAHEVELHLRSTLSPGSATGYEINYSVETDGNRYAQIVRWNGPGGSFTGFASVLPPVLATGDVLCASISGSTITLTRNGTLVMTGRDSTFTSGAPGMGFWNNYYIGDNANFGFSSFTATDGQGAPPPPPPPPTPAPTASITAAPSTITPGASTTLTWATLNATTITINGIGAPPMGTEQISPMVTTTYTITAIGAGGTVSKSVTVTVSSGVCP